MVEVALDLSLMPLLSQDIGSELNVVKIPAFAWNAIYTRARLRLAHAIACRRGFA